MLEVSRVDIGHIDELIGVLNKVRFDVNGPECMRLATSLAWFGQLRQKIVAEVSAGDDEKNGRIEQALKALAQNETVARDTVAKEVAPDPEASETEDPAPLPIAAAKPKGKTKG